MLEVGETLTLSDNRKYLVVYTTTIDSKNYAYLMDQEDISNPLLCEYDGNNHVEEVMEPELIEKILREYLDNKDS